MSEYSSKFLELIKPSKSFDDTKPPSKPDYSDIYNWAATPSIEASNFMFLIQNIQLVKIMISMCFIFILLDSLRLNGIPIWIKKDLHMSEQRLC